jgi:hypothetical protein
MSLKRRSKLTTVPIILIFMVKKRPLVILVSPLVGLCTGSRAWTSSNPVSQRSGRTLILLGQYLLIPLGPLFFKSFTPCEDLAHSSLMIDFPVDFNALIGFFPTRPITHILASLIPQMSQGPPLHPPLLTSLLSSIHPPQAPPH